MLKRALCLIFSLIMTTSILFGSVLSVNGEELTESASTSPAVSGAAEEAETAATTLPAATVSTSLFPALSVSAISNYFGRVDADYNEYTSEFTITFYLKSSKNVLSTNWTLVYDSALLNVDPEKNTKLSICPAMDKGSSVSFEQDDKNGKITYNATSLNLFDFSTQDTVFAKIVFDAPNLTAADTETAKVDLSVDELWVSELDPLTAISALDKEIALVSKGDLVERQRKKDLSVSARVEITHSTFTGDFNGAATKDEAVTTIPASTVKPTEPPKPTEVVDPKKDVTLKDNNDVNTGEWYIALLILAMLIVCSTILLILRKRDIYND